MKTNQEIFFTYLLEDVTFSRMVELWNEFCQESEDASLDDLIYVDVEDLILVNGFDGVQAARRMFSGNVTHLYQYAYLDGYGNIQNANGLRESPIDLSALAAWLEESNHPTWVEFVAALEEDAEENE